MLRRQMAHTLIKAEEPGVTEAAVVVLMLSMGGAKQALQMLLLRSVPIPDLYISSFLAQLALILLEQDVG